MTSARPYEPGYKQVSHHEWRTAENSAQYLIPIIQSLAKTKPNLTLLDVGCGSGTITASLAKYMPQGHITAADLSEEVLSKARSYADKANVTNITTQVASVFDLLQVFGEGRFDIVCTSMMLCHLDEPVDALKQMLAVCKPDGGVVAAREADLRMISIFPEYPALRQWHETTLRLHHGSIDGGAKLLHWALAAGVKREDMTLSMSTWCYSTPEEKTMWSEAVISRLEEGTWKQTFTADGTPEGTLAQMVRSWRRWANCEDANFGSMHGELVIRRGGV